MPTDLASLAGWIPAVIFPGATFMQLVAVIRSPRAEGVSALTWTLFGLANIALYIYAEKHTDVQSILGFVLTAVLDFLIVAIVLRRRGRGARGPQTGSA